MHDIKCESQKERERNSGEGDQTEGSWFCSLYLCHTIYVRNCMLFHYKGILKEV